MRLLRRGWFPTSRSAARAARIACLGVTVVCCSSCALVLEVVEFFIFGEVGVGVGARGLLRGVRPRGLRIPEASRGVLRGRLEAAARFRAPGPLRVSRSNELLLGEERIGSLRAGGDVFLRDVAGVEVAVGRVWNGRVWGLDAGGNLSPLASITGTASAEVLQVLARPVRSARLVASLRKPVSFDVLRVRDGWYEIRISSGQSGWVPAELIALSLVASEDEGARQLGTSACAAYRLSVVADEGDSGMGADGRREPGETRSRSMGDANWQPPDIWQRVLRGREVVVRYAPGSGNVGLAMADRFRRLSAHVVREESDSTATLLCGGEVYYPASQLESAQAAQAVTVDVVRLRVSSVEAGARIVVWLPLK